MNRESLDETCPIASDDPDEPLVIQPAFARWLASCFLWVFATFWCGISGVGLVASWNGKGWLGIACFGLFTLIGLFVLLGAIYTTLQVFNPRPVIVVSQRYVYPGTDFEISWMFRGKASRIQRLKISFEGFEKVAYQQGTSTRSEESLFFRSYPLDTTEPSNIEKGFCLASLPKDAMHSFRSQNNEIGWRIKLHGSISLWPDISEEYPLIVRIPTREISRHG